MKRDEILRAADECVSASRAETYGDAAVNLGEIAKAWNWWLGERISDPLDAFDVAQMMSLLKKARCKNARTHADNYVDDAGYTALAGEIGGWVADSVGGIDRSPSSHNNLSIECPGCGRMRLVSPMPCWNCDAPTHPGGMDFPTDDI